VSSRDFDRGAGDEEMACLGLKGMLDFDVCGLGMGMDQRRWRG